MNLTKVNNYAFRVVCAIVCLFLFSGAWGMYENQLYIKALIGIITSLTIIWLALRQASIKYWGLMVFLLLFAMYLVGAVKN